jgi:hypothetical protein
MNRISMTAESFADTSCLVTGNLQKSYFIFEWQQNGNCFFKANYDIIYRRPSKRNKILSEYLLITHGWNQYRYKKAYILRNIIYETCPIRDLTSHNILIRTLCDHVFRSECTNILFIAMDRASVLHSNIFLTELYRYVLY